MRSVVNYFPSSILENMGDSDGTEVVEDTTHVESKERNKNDNRNEEILY